MKMKNNSNREFVRMMNPTVTAVATQAACYERNEGQVFANTETAWELWQIAPRRRLKSIPRKTVRWVFENETLDGFFRVCNPPRRRLRFAGAANCSKQVDVHTR